MRLWHYKLISKLDRQRLLGQHRECSALRGKGWGKKHSVVDYVFENNYYKLYVYHLMVMAEMMNRGYKVDKDWLNMDYRGKQLGYVDCDDLPNIAISMKSTKYKEHNKKYLEECLAILKKKGLDLYGN